MDSRNLMTRIVGAAVLLLVLGQAWSLRNLREEVRELKASTQTERASEDARAAPRATRGGERGQRGVERRSVAAPEAARTRAATERSASGGSADEEELARVVERAMSKRDNEQKERRFQQRMTMMEEGLTMQFEELSEIHELTVDQEEQAMQLILASMEQGMDLRMQVGEGTISMMEAKEEGAAIKEETNQGVVELIGEDAAEALWEIMANNK